MDESHPLTGLGTYRREIERTLREMTERKIVVRIWNHDHTVWKPDPDEIINRLGWLHIVESMRQETDRLKRLAGSLHDDGYRQVLLLGMGGSSLAPQVFRSTFGVREKHLDLAVLDSTDPEAVRAHAERIDPARTLFIVATKSGGTVETLSFFKYFFRHMTEAVGGAEAGRHFIAITDPGSALTEMAEAYRFRKAFLNDPNIGGRYSALSFFGLVPAALVGVDLTVLLDRAVAMIARCGPDVPAGENPAASLGAVLGHLAAAGRDKLTLVLSPPVDSFGDWIEQLIAESSGKEETGILPVVGEALGPPEVYGRDRLFVHLRLASDQTHDDALAELEKAGHPVIWIDLLDRHDLGGQFFLWELATAVAGHLMGINPFDQPDVESAKVQARRMVAEYQEKGHLPKEASSPVTAAALKDFLSSAAEGDYIALQAYLPPTAEMDRALAGLRLRLRDTYHLAVTVGYGPRFLHSTGQLHKGDGGRGLFIQFISESARDAPIPDRADASDSSVSFAVLKKAQALGDRQALLDGGRQVITFQLEEDPAGQLDRLADEV
jgi:glucose-6-phosphate isomerase